MHGPNWPTGNGDALSRKTDQMAVLPIFAVLVVVRREAPEQRFDAVRLVVADSRVVGVVHRQMLDFDAETARTASRATALEESEHARHMLRVRFGK